MLGGRRALSGSFLPGSSCLRFWVIFVDLYYWWFLHIFHLVLSVLFFWEEYPLLICWTFRSAPFIFLISFLLFPFSFVFLLDFLRTFNFIFQLFEIFSFQLFFNFQGLFLLPESFIAPFSRFIRVIFFSDFSEDIDTSVDVFFSIYMLYFL